MQSTLQHEMNHVVDAFVAQILDLARRAARHSLESALGPDRDRSLPRRQAGRPRGSRSAKRTASDLEAISTRFVAFVRANPGLRIEQINQRLGTTTKELVLPIRKLLDDKLLHVEGRNRSTTYYAAESPRN